MFDGPICARRARADLGVGGLELLECELELLDRAVELLRGSAKLQPAQLRNLQLQAGNLDLALKQESLLFEDLCPLLVKQMLQALYIVGKFVACGHATQYIANTVDAKTRQSITAI
jgi:hypothetical protein